jgi:hypothetical protein
MIIECRQTPVEYHKKGSQEWKADGLLRWRTGMRIMVAAESKIRDPMRVCQSPFIG